MMELMFYGYDIMEVLGPIFYVVIGFILFDVITGLLASAKERQINSSINYDGLIRKAGEVVGIVFLTFVDYYLQMSGNIVKMGVGLIIVYEAISIIENFSRIGVQIGFLKKFFDPKKLGKGDRDEKDIY